MCSGPSSVSGSSSYYRADSYPSSAAHLSENALATPEVFNQKMIYTASIEVKVKEAATIPERIKAITAQYEGYIVRISERNATIKVPAARLNEAVEAMSALGKVKEKRIVAQDVTDAYNDAEIRLENLIQARKRYLELLEQAQTVEEILKVEKELERVNTEIETFKGRLQRMDNQVSYSEIYVQYDQKVKPGVLGYVFKGLYRGVRWLFVRGG